MRGSFGELCYRASESHDTRPDALVKIEEMCYERSIPRLMFSKSTSRFKPTQNLNVQGLVGYHDGVLNIRIDPIGQSCSIDLKRGFHVTSRSERPPTRLPVFCSPKPSQSTQNHPIFFATRNNHTATPVCHEASIPRIWQTLNHHGSLKRTKRRRTTMRM